MGLAFVRQGGFGVRLFVVHDSVAPVLLSGPGDQADLKKRDPPYGAIRIQVAPWSSVRIVRPSVVTTVARRPSVAWMETKSVR